MKYLIAIILIGLIAVAGFIVQLLPPGFFTSDSEAKTDVPATSVSTDTTDTTTVPTVSSRFVRISRERDLEGHRDTVNVYRDTVTGRDYLITNAYQGGYSVTLLAEASPQDSQED